MTEGGFTDYRMCGLTGRVIAFLNGGYGESQNMQGSILLDREGGKRMLICGAVNG
jgi:hypothetical protein